MLSQEHLVQAVIDELLFPEVGPPCLEGVPVRDGVKVLGELALVQLKKVVDLVVLAHTGLHAGRILLALVELDQESREGLQDSRHLFLQNAAAGVGVDKDHDLVVEIPEPFELEGREGLEEGESS